MNNKSAAFTLIELMIVIAVLGILAAITYPKYQHYALEARRTIAKADLYELSSFLERYYGEHFSYDLTLTDTELPFTTSPKRGKAYYELSSENLSDTTYTLLAEPFGSQADDRCGTLTLNQAGQHHATADDC